MPIQPVDKTPYPCETCGTPIINNRNNPKRRPRFCSLDCYGKSLKDKPSGLRHDDAARKKMGQARKDAFAKRRDIWTKTEVQPGGCIHWTGSRNKHGYGKIYLGRNENGSKIEPFAHRWAWEHHNGPIPDGMIVCHKCDNPICMNPSHLFLGTDTDNMADRDSKGRQARGERSKLSKLTAQDVTAIRALHSQGFKIGRLAEMFGITYPGISGIVHRRTWKHIP